MRQLILSLFILALLFFAGCSNDSPSLSTFTVTVNDSYVADATNAWVVMYDNAGKVLSYQPAKSGRVLKFDVPSGTSPTLLTILYFPFSTDTSYIVESYSGITQQDLALGRKAHIENSSSGESTFNFTDVPNPTALSYSSRNNFSNGGQYTSGGFISGYLKAPINSDSKKSIFITATNNAKPYYKLVNNIENTSNFNIPYADMDEFDSYLTIDFPPTLIFGSQVYGFESDQTRDEYGFTIFNTYLTAPRPQKCSSVVVGYLNTLADFNTIFTATYDDYRLSFNAVGSVPPTNIVWPSPEGFSVADKSVGNLTVAPGTNFLYRNTYWVSDFSTGGNNSGVYRYSNSPFVTERIDDIPAALLAVHPKLSTKFGVYYSTTFTTSGTPYSDFVDYMISDKYHSVQLERVSIIVKK